MQSLILRAVKQVGYEIIHATGELPPRIAEIRHAPILPDNSTYSPWLSDSYFQIASERVWGYSSRDQLRCYELWSLVRQSKKLSAGAVVEAGNRRGDTGCLIAQAAAHFGISEPVYFCCQLDGADPSHRGSKESLEALAARLQLAKVDVVESVVSANLSTGKGGHGLRLVHLGSDITQRLTGIEHLWQPLVPGGIMIISNYGIYGCEGLTSFVNEMSLRDDCLFVHNLNGHGILIKRSTI